MGATIKIAAEMYKISERTVYNTFDEIRFLTTQSQEGFNIAIPIDSSWGGRRNAYLTPEDESRFLMQFLEEALDGKLVTIEKIHKAFNELVEETVEKSTIYMMLKRNNWRKLMPDKKHPKSDPAIQELFRNETLLSFAEAIKKTTDKPILIFFQDEARFGRLSEPVSCWAPAPARPVVNIALVRQYEYVFGAVCPQTGDLEFMTAPDMKTDNMSLFLSKVSDNHPEKEIIMVVDGASTHKSKSLVVPNNVHILVLPPYSPELNPVEVLWNVARRNCFANQYYETLDEAILNLTLYLKKLKRKPDEIKRLTFWPWISNIVDHLKKQL
jgi:transposase